MLSERRLSSPCFWCSVGVGGFTFCFYFFGKIPTRVGALLLMKRVFVHAFCHHLKKSQVSSRKYVSAKIFFVILDVHYFYIKLNFPYSLFVILFETG